MPKSKRRFEIEIEATLAVAAFDEDSARKKIEKALAGGRSVGPDVTATGKVFTYSAIDVSSDS